MTSRSKLLPETVEAVKEIATRHETQIKARRELRDLAVKNDEFHYAVRACYRLERRRIEGGST